MKCLFEREGESTRDKVRDTRKSERSRWRERADGFLSVIDLRMPEKKSRAYRVSLVARAANNNASLRSAGWVSSEKKVAPARLRKIAVFHGGWNTTPASCLPLESVGER